MKLKRIMAFTLAACLMMSSMTVLAADYTGDNEPNKESVTAGQTWEKTDGSIWTAKEQEKTDGSGDKEIVWECTTPAPKPSEGDGDGEKGDSSSSSSSTVSAPGTVSASSAVSAPAPAAPKTLSRVDIINIVTRAETIALQATARDEGFADMVDMQTAAAKNMSAGEYYNNAAVETPGIEEATPVAQGGGIIINGVVTNVMATISKVDVAFVDSVRASVEGTVLNVVDVRFPAVEATINFYMPGVTADASIVAVQYVDGAWVDVEVAEVRADHVVLNLKQNGKVAFLAK